MSHQSPTSIRLSRRGTFIANSSQYTRAAEILNTNDITVGVDGVADHKPHHSSRHSANALTFVSVQSNLDRIFHNASNTHSPPPPPPPPPPPQTNSSPIAATSSVSSEASFDAPARVATPPPLDAMFAHPKTRHQKVTKATLADLPPELLHQQPLVRGGVVQYTIHDPHQHSRFGHFVEVSAEEYIQNLRSTIRALHMQLSLNNAYHQSAESAPAVKPYSRALRMSSFINKRSKDATVDPSTEKTAKPATRTASLLSRRTTSVIHTSPPPDRTDNQPPDNLPKLKSTVSFPQGFGYTDNSHTSTKTSDEHSENTTPSYSATSHVTFSSATSDIPAAALPEQSTIPMMNISGPRTSVRSGREKSVGYVDVHQGAVPTNLSSGRRSSITIDRTLSPKITPLQQDSIRDNQSFNRNRDRAASQKRKDVVDRQTGPMSIKGSSRRNAKLASVTRTRSFSGLLGDTLSRKNSNVGPDADKVSRAFSMHHDPLSTAHSTQKATERFGGKKTRAIRMFLSRRSGK